MDNKTKKEILIFILLLFLGLNYAIYTYYLTPQFTNLSALEKDYLSKKYSLMNLDSIQAEIDKVTAEIADDKDKSSELSDLTSKTQNTPQLIYDFYNACKEHGVSGDNITFQVNVITSNPISSDSNTSATDTSTTDKASTDTTLIKLAINLAISGNKTNIIDFISNLSNITEKKLTITSINLITNGDVSETIAGTLPKQAEMNAVIIFTQYILPDEASSNDLKNYYFYDGKNGFDSISNMLK